MAEPRPTHTRPAEDPEPPGDRGAQKGQRAASATIILYALVAVAAIVAGWVLFASASWSTGAIVGVSVGIVLAAVLVGFVVWGRTA